MTITQNVKQVLGELPRDVRLVVAAKSREPRQIREAIAAGAAIIGENYVREAETARAAVGHGAAWHCIGHLQKNKVKKAVAVFDLIETVDSRELACEIDRRCAEAGKIMPVLIEINSGGEAQKAGVMPEDAVKLAGECAELANIIVMGLMTMGPAAGKPEEMRPYFRRTRKLFEEIKRLNLPGVEMRYLSMGMSDSYRVAVEEGANIVRLGRRIFDDASPD